LLQGDINDPARWETGLTAAKRCAGQGGEIHLLGVVHDLGSALISSFLPEGFERKAMEELKAKLGELADASFSPNETVETHVGHEHVPETILRVAEQIGADLIVMASHPPNDFETLLVGSNADKVVRHSPIPVLTLR